MIYDCFIFNNELDVLDIRLHELNSVVDKFVLVESTVTHVNRPKPLYYMENRDKFKEFNKKIVHIVVEDMPDVSLAWILNDFHFSQMIRGLKKCKDDDVILFGDVDEIPNAMKINFWKNKPGKHKLFLQRLFYYYLNLCEYTEKSLNGTHMMKYKDLIALKSMWIAKYSPIDVEIPDGGWHFSYLTDAYGIKKKLESMAHQEFNNEKYNTLEKIRKAMTEGKDLFGRNLKFKLVPITTLPLYVRKNRNKFNKYIFKKNSSFSSFVFIYFFFLDTKGLFRKIFRFVRKKINILQ